MALCKIFVCVVFAGYMYFLNYYSSFTAADPLNDSTVLERLYAEDAKYRPDATTSAVLYPISLKFTADFDFIWSDRGSGADDDVSIYRPRPDCQYYPLGDLAQSNYNPPSDAAAFVMANDFGAVATPVGFHEVWADHGSGAHRDVKIFRMIPPPGFTCIGYVAIEGYGNMPDPDLYRCVKSEYVATYGVFRYIWDDEGSGGHDDGSIFNNDNKGNSVYIHANTFTAFKSHGQPGHSPQSLLASKAEEILTCGIDLPYVFKPIYMFDKNADDYCYPDWPSTDNNGRCLDTLNQNAPIFHQEYKCGDYIVYSYHIWFGEQKGCFFSAGEHNNDWEHVSVFITKACTVHSVVYHQHTGHYTRHVGTYHAHGYRPVVFVGQISPGSYHEYCTQECSLEEFFTKGCWGSVTYCYGGCSYWDDVRDAKEMLSDATLYPYNAGETIDGIYRRAKPPCDIGTCAGNNHRVPKDAGCWQNAP